MSITNVSTIARAELSCHFATLAKKGIRGSDNSLQTTEPSEQETLYAAHPPNSFEEPSNFGDATYDEGSESKYPELGQDFHDPYHRESEDDGL